MSLFTSSLAYTFRSIFSREMGRKFWGVVGSLPGLGIVITKADSISLGKEDEDAAWLNKLHR